MTITIFTDTLQVGDRFYTVAAARPSDVPSMALDMLITFVRTGHWRPRPPASSACDVDPGGIIANREHLPERVWEMISSVVYEAMANRKRLEWVYFNGGCVLRIHDADAPAFAAGAAE